MPGGEIHTQHGDVWRIRLSQQLSHSVLDYSGGAAHGLRRKETVDDQLFAASRRGLGVGIVLSKLFPEALSLGLSEERFCPLLGVDGQLGAQLGVVDQLFKGLHPALAIAGEQHIGSILEDLLISGGGAHD